MPSVGSVGLSGTYGSILLPKRSTKRPKRFISDLHATECIVKQPSYQTTFHSPFCEGNPPHSHSHPHPATITTTMWGLSTLVSRASVLAFASPSSMTTTQRCSIATSTTALAATQYLLKYDYVPDILEKRGPHREKHLGLAQELIDQGKCLSGGPTGPIEMQVPTGALFLFTDLEAAQQFTQQDPYVEAGLVTSHSIEEWNVVLSKE